MAEKSEKNWIVKMKVGVVELERVFVTPIINTIS